MIFFYKIWYVHSIVCTKYDRVLNIKLLYRLPCLFGIMTDPYVTTCHCMFLSQYNVTNLCEFSLENFCGHIMLVHIITYLITIVKKQLVMMEGGRE